jgi:hypothetical protein
MIRTLLFLLIETIKVGGSSKRLHPDEGSDGVFFLKLNYFLFKIY